GRSPVSSTGRAAPTARSRRSSSRTAVRKDNRVRSSRPTTWRWCSVASRSWSRTSTARPATAGRGRSRSIRTGAGSTFVTCERSPITYVDRIRCPLLVLQGENDPRVPKLESDQVVERLRALGRQVEYVVYPDEGHGFTKRANQDDALERILAFLTRELLES